MAAVIAIRDNPESCGVRIDGAAHDPSARAVDTVPDMTLDQARRTPVFWLYSLAFIRYFGALHLGEVSGMVSATMVLGSAIGPALFSLGLDWSGSYAAAEWCV